MKHLLVLILAVISGIFYAQAQTDTTGTTKSDTVKVGNFVIIKEKKNKNAGNADTEDDKNTTIKIHIGDNDNDSDDDDDDDHKKSKTTSTNYFILDLGFANFRDNTDYGSNPSYLNTLGGAPFTSSDLKLNTGKSTNVNLWLFMQKLNVSRHVLNLKYGLGMEMYNFRYKNSISYNDNPAFIFRDSVQFSKNKLFVNYVTVPFMVNLNP